MYSVLPLTSYQCWYSVANRSSCILGCIVQVCDTADKYNFSHRVVKTVRFFGSNRVSVFQLHCRVFSRFDHLFFLSRRLQYHAPSKVGFLVFFVFKTPFTAVYVQIKQNTWGSKITTLPPSPTTTAVYRVRCARFMCNILLQYYFVVFFFRFFQLYIIIIYYDIYILRFAKKNYKKLFWYILLSLRVLSYVSTTCVKS